MTPPSRIERVLFLAAVVASVVPLFAVEILPFTDVPEHLAVMASLRHWFEPAYRIQEHYELALLRSQYLLYHLAGAGLAFPFGVDLANRLLLAAAGFAQPFAARALLRALGRDERLAIFAVPLFWNRALVLGFLPFVASIPLLLGALTLVVRQLDPASATRRRGIGLAALSVVVFYVHASAFMLLAVIGVALTIEANLVSAAMPFFDRARRLARGLVWLAPASVVALGWSLLGRITLHGASLSDEGEIGRINALRSVRAFSLWAHDIYPSHADEVCAVGYWAAFIVLLVTGIRHAARSDAPPRMFRLLVPLLCVLALYFLLPFRVGAAAMLNVRMAPLLALFALLPLEVAPGLIARCALAAALLVSFATSTNAGREMRALVREEAAGVTSLFEETAAGTRLVMLPFDSRSPRTHFPPFIHMGAYHRVRNGGVSSFSFSELAHWPLHYRAEAAPPKKPTSFWSLNPCVFRNAVDGPYYDYALVKGSLDPFRDQPPGPSWRMVRRVKDFALYEKLPLQPWSPWSAPDRGPCVSRAQVERGLERAADVGETSEDLSQ